MNASLSVQEIKELVEDWDSIYLETGIATFCVTSLFGGKRRATWAYKTPSGLTVYENQKHFDESDIDELVKYIYDEVKDFIVTPHFNGFRNKSKGDIHVPF